NNAAGNLPRPRARLVWRRRPPAASGRACSHVGFDFSVSDTVLLPVHSTLGGVAKMAKATSENGLELRLGRGRRGHAGESGLAKLAPGPGRVGNTPVLRSVHRTNLFA